MAGTYGMEDAVEKGDAEQREERPNRCTALEAVDGGGELAVEAALHAIDEEERPAQFGNGARARAGECCECRHASNEQQERADQAQVTGHSQATWTRVG